MRISTLSSAVLVRKGERGVDEKGRECGRTGRRTYDFVVDGVSLGALLGLAETDNVGRFDAGGSERMFADMSAENETARAAFCGESPDPHAVDGELRVLLYVCAECLDIGCGAFTAVLTVDRRYVTWSDFRWEDWDPEGIDAKTYASVGPFTFRRREYEQLLRRLASRPRGAQEESDRAT